MDLSGKVALVAGATRGAGRGIAAELGAAGATVYVTGRTTRAARSEYDRPETIEETAELVAAAGGTRHRRRGRSPRSPTRCAASSSASAPSRGGSTSSSTTSGAARSCSSGTSRSGSTTSQNGLRLLRLAIDTHLITAHHALPLMIERPGGLLVEVTDGTADYNAEHYRINPFYDLAKVAVNRMAWAHARDLGAARRRRRSSLTPGWLRSEMMLEAFGVSEANWRDATAQVPHFVISETPRFVGRAVAALAADPDRARWNGQSLSSGELAAGLRLHRPRRLAPRRLALRRRGAGRRQAGRRHRLPLGGGLRRGGFPPSAAARTSARECAELLPRPRTGKKAGAVANRGCRQPRPSASANRDANSGGGRCSWTPACTRTLDGLDAVGEAT